MLLRRLECHVLLLLCHHIDTRRWYRYDLCELLVLLARVHSPFCPQKRGTAVRLPKPPRARTYVHVMTTDPSIRRRLLLPGGPARTAVCRRGAHRLLRILALPPHLERPHEFLA